MGWKESNLSSTHSEVQSLLSEQQHEDELQLIKIIKVEVGAVFV